MSLKFFDLISEATPTPLAGGAVAPSSAGKVRAARNQNNPTQQPAQPAQQNTPQVRQNPQSTSTTTQSQSSAQTQKVDVNKRVDEIYNKIEKEIQDYFSPKNKNSVKDPIFLEKAKWLFLLAKSNTTIKR